MLILIEKKNTNVTKIFLFNMPINDMYICHTLLTYYTFWSIATPSLFRKKRIFIIASIYYQFIILINIGKNTRPSIKSF